LTPSGRSRRIKGYQKPGYTIPEKVVVIGDDATNIEDDSAEDEELHATDSESVSDSLMNLRLPELLLMSILVQKVNKD
jgi:hypothetical protein